MHAEQIAKALAVAYELRRPTFIWGPPGVGKSETVASTAEKLKLDMRDFRMALRDPTDIKGFPMPDQSTKTMKFYRDAELPTKGRGILFMDELNNAAPATQAAGAQLTLDGRIGDYQLPAGWMIVAAGNRETDRAVVHTMPTHLRNRFTHLEFEVSADAWCHWAIDNKISPELIAWVRFRPSMLFAFDPAKNERAFPTPRSWVALDRIRVACGDDSVAYEMGKGTVGDGPASEYWAFLKLIKELPSIDEIKLDPTHTTVPTNPGTQYAVMTMLATHTTKQAFATLMKYVERLPKEYQAVYVRDVLRRDNALKTEKTFTEWAIRNEKVIC